MLSLHHLPTPDDDFLHVVTALSDEARLGILIRLAERPMCVSELTSSLEIDISSTSRKIRQLVECGLLKRAKEKNHRIYSLTSAIQVDFDVDGFVCIYITRASNNGFTLRRHRTHFLFR